MNEARDTVRRALTSLDAESVDRLLEVGRLVHIPQGWTPIRQGEPADEAYFILEGEVQIVLAGEDVTVLGAGEFVGEMGLVDRSLRSARVTVVEPVLAVAWPRADFAELQSELDDFARLVAQTTAERRAANVERDG